MDGALHVIIYRRYFFETDCYKAGVIQQTSGIQVHSTGASNPYLKRWVQPDDGRLGINKYNNSHNRPGCDVCANAYIGKLQDGTVAIYQTLPWNMRCWLSGSGANGNANKYGFIGFEICEDSKNNEEYFRQAVQEAAVYLTAHLCKINGLTPWEIVGHNNSGDILAVEDHANLHKLGLASNHADIGHWLKIFGYTFNDFRNWVDDAMNRQIEVTYIDCDTDQPIDTEPAPDELRELIKRLGKYSIVNIWKAMREEWG